MTKPKHFVVKTDNTNPLQITFKRWLNDTHNDDWNIYQSLYKYYGYDGNGIKAYDNLKDFVNNPAILTLDEWYVLFIDNKCDFVIECKNNEEFDYVAVKYNHVGVMCYDSQKKDCYPNHKVISFNIYKEFIVNNNQTTKMKNQLTLKQLKQLYKSDSCGEWQKHIIDNYLIPNVLVNDTANIKIKQESIQLLTSKGSETQKKLVENLGIILENKYPKSWEELDGSLKGYYITIDSDIRHTTTDVSTKPGNKNIIPTKELSEEILEFIQLSQCYYRYVGDWKPDFSDGRVKFGLKFFDNKLQKHDVQWTHIFFTFPTPEMRDEFMENFKNQLEKCKSLV